MNEWYCASVKHGSAVIEQMFRFPWIELKKKKKKLSKAKLFYGQSDLMMQDVIATYLIVNAASHVMFGPLSFHVKTFALAPCCIGRNKEELVWNKDARKVAHAV